MFTKDAIFATVLIILVGTIGMLMAANERALEECQAARIQSNDTCEFYSR